MMFRKSTVERGGRRVRGARWSALLVVGLHLGTVPDALAQSSFLRGDSNDDGSVDVSDALCTLQYLFGGGGETCRSEDCLDARDTNDDGQLDITDAITTLAYLFLGGPPPELPFRECGVDPTPDDGLGCTSAIQCQETDTVTLEVGPGVELYSMWGEGYDTVMAQHAVLSVIRFREGMHRFFLLRDTENLGLIESFRFGPDLETALPVDGGTFFFRPERWRAYEYEQSFQTAAGKWTFHLNYEPDENRHDVVDCEFLDDASLARRRVTLYAVLETSSGGRFVQYACFSPQVWSPPSGGTPRRITLEDGTIVAFHIEDCWELYRGIAGDTTNRHITRASLDRGGHHIEVTEHERLIYAGVHHNWREEFRVLLAEPVEGIHGVDLVECPAASAPTCDPAENAVAYFLDEALERSVEVAITEYTVGE